MPTLMGKRERLLWLTADDMKRYEPGEHAELIHGRNWDGNWQTAPNAWQVTAVDEVAYEEGEHATLAGGTGWAGAWQTAANYARIIGEDNANGYATGTTDAPWPDAIGLGTPSYNNASIVVISGSDLGWALANGAIAWPLPAEPWEELDIGCLIHLPVTAATGLGADSLRVGLCNGAGGVPGLVADGSVGNAIFWRSVAWSYHASSGTLQAAANNAAQLGKLVSGLLSTANISTISRVGAISSDPAVVRCPVVLTISKGSPNFSLAIARRTTTTTGPGFDRTEGLIRAATENDDPAGVMGAQHNQHSQSIAFSEGDGALTHVFLQADNAYFSGIYVRRKS